MAGDEGLLGTRQEFRIHGGKCVLDSRALHVDQTFLRHHHVLGWLFTLAAAVCAGYGFATGWQYTAGTGAPNTTGTGVLLGWESFLALTGIMLAIPVWRRVRERYEGYTNAKTIRLSAIERVTLSTTEIQWYFKTSKTVPVCVVRYRRDAETRKRRFKLPLRSGQEAVQEAVDAFEDAGFRIEVDLTEGEIPGAADASRS